MVYGMHYQCFDGGLAYCFCCSIVTVLELGQKHDLLLSCGLHRMCGGLQLPDLVTCVSHPQEHDQCSVRHVTQHLRSFLQCLRGATLGAASGACDVKSALDGQVYGLRCTLPLSFVSSVVCIVSAV